PPAGRGRNALTALGGGVLVLAVAGVAWVAFGRDTSKNNVTANGPTTSAPANPILGPVAPGAATSSNKPTVSPTSTRPVAAPGAATASASAAPVVKPTAAPVATLAPTAAPSKAPVAGPVAPTAAPTQAPVVQPPAPAPVAKPPVTAPQQVGTVAKKDYTFKVARGDTLWELTTRVLNETGRSTSNANVVAYVNKLYQANKATIGSNPNLIVIGATLAWPSGL
ncbi:MAG: hypothetical protein ABIO67_00070, partial [Mycobacteriales bacterium]